MKITIAICTFNKARLLDRTLRSLAKVKPLATGDYEILIINNHCTDSTPDILKQWIPFFDGKLRVIDEHRQGLSHARNRALHESKAEIVAFIDDDVELDADWLIAVEEAFDQCGATLVGGKCYLIFEEDRPFWLTRRCEAFLSCCDHGDQLLINPDKDLYGLNFSVRRRAALDHGGFPTNLGRIGTSLLSGEETVLQARIKAAGQTVIYQPKALLGHVITGQRLRRSWFARRMYWGGYGKAIMDRMEGESRSFLWLVENCVRSFGSWLRAIFQRKEQADIFDRKLNFMWALGLLRGSLSRAGRMKSAIK